jgi:hypothetical protein
MQWDSLQLQLTDMLIGWLTDYVIAATSATGVNLVRERYMP